MDPNENLSEAERLRALGVSSADAPPVDSDASVDMFDNIAGLCGFCGWLLVIGGAVLLYDAVADSRPKIEWPIAVGVILSSAPLFAAWASIRLLLIIEKRTRAKRA